MKKILFISHDANRAGAQILLLRFLEKLPQYSDFKFKILLGFEGDLVKDFVAVAETYHWYHKRYVPRYQRPFQRLLPPSDEQTRIRKELERQRFDLVVSNTVTNGALLDELRFLACPVVTYAHELEMGIGMYTTPEAFQTVLERSDYFLACSKALKDRYVANYGLSPQHIDVLPSLLPHEAYTTVPTPEQGRVIRQRWNIPAEAPLVGAMGTLDWRKGIDIFVQLARLSAPDVHFAWVGGTPDQPEAHMLREDLRRLNLSSRVHLIPAQTNPLEYMSSFDVFALPSREEPYPLVVLEAALMQKPIVCFDQSGGARELVETDAGYVCEYLNANQMASRIAALLSDGTLRRQMGAVGRQKVLERHGEEHAMRVFVDLLEQYASHRTARRVSQSVAR
jgi:glycosyltransferase involved in cell wall biosynthesis